MRIAQTECGKLVIPEKAESTITTQKQQQSSIPTAPILATALIFTSTTATTATTSTTIKTEIKSKDENVCSKDAAASTSASGKMTDEHSSESNDIKTKCSDSNSRGNSGKNENKSSNDNECIIAGDADILLKNDLNGNNAAIVATAKTNSLLSVTSPFQLKHPSLSQSTKNLVLLQSPSSVQVARSSSPKLLEPKKLSTPTLGSTIGCQQQDKILNNGFSVYFSSPLSTEKTAELFTSNANKMAAATANPPLAHLNAGINTISDVCLKSDNGVIDYTTHNSLSPGTVSNNSSINNKKLAVRTLTTNNSNNTNSNSGNIDNSNINNGVDIGRSAIFSASGGINMNASVNCGGGSGGRLQFFKEGKIILELQRSKDGDKSGWVSVSRKPFRPPAATSSTVTPTSAACSGYAKNESSTSLSFSDDNSSVQSSPWQRDHCWKQLTPRCGISKEMSLLYRRPKDVELTQRALHLALKKRRRPYDTMLDGNVKSIFEKINNLINISPNNSGNEKEKSTLPAEELKISTEITINDINDGKVDGAASSSLSLSSTVTLANANRANSDIKSEKKLSEDFLNGLGVKKNGENIASNISEDDEIIMVDVEKGKNANLKVNRNVDDKTALADIKNEIEAQLEKTVDNSNMCETTSKVDAVERTEDKRLKMKTKKVRAKLSIIIQKLINNAPSHTIQSSLKTFSLPPPSGTVGNSHANNNALSPISSSAIATATATATVVVTATTTTSRLVEYHQQHVSPRKRILRQFEKVSLEDNAAIIGVKRSRAKNTTNSQIHNQQSNVTASSTHIRTHPVALGANQNLLSTNSSVNHQQKSKPITSSSPPISAAAPPRLYSSYSIHSLLSGSNGSSSSLSSSSSAASKKTTKANDTAIVSSNLGYQHPQIYADPSYLHAVLATPKSPENQSSISAGGGKSSSTSTSSKKRSPPYSSTMQDAGIEYGRCSPRVSTSLESNSGISTRTNKYNMRFSAGHSVPSSTNSQNLYSSYMTSPKFTTPSTSHLHHTATSNILANATGHMSESAKYIPQTSVVSSAVPRELSPARSATSSPRDFTRRTVPKKTVSIRRQFASPITANANSSSLSPKDRESDRERIRDRYQEWNRSNMSLEDISAQHASTFRQRGSSVAVGSVPISSSLPYYIYPPDNDSLSPHASVTAPPPSVVNPSVAAAVAAASAYIPPVVSPSYFPYISTLAALRHNPMWLHYPGSMPGILPTNHPTTSVPTARLSPPFHTFPPYNGIAVAHHNMLTSVSTTMHNHHSAGILDCAQLPKLTDSGADHSTTTTKNTITSSTFEGAASSTLFSSNNIVKEELSSDIPLNLSKH